MPSTASTTYQDGIEAKLLTAVSTTTTTGITLKIKQINGVTPTAPTAAHRLHVIQKTALVNKHEIFGVAAGTTQSGQTVTLGTVTRALPLSDGTTFTGTGTAQSFAAGADVILSWDAHDAAQSAKLDIANTFTAANTFSGLVTYSGGLLPTGTTNYLQVPSLTTTQRNALTPANGMIVYDSTIGVHYQYIGGTWTTFATGTVVNMSLTEAGKAEAATVAEQASHAAAGGTGALAVPTTNNLVTLGADATWVSGAIPTLNTSKFIDGSIGGTGVASPALGALLIGGGAGLAMTQLAVGVAGTAPISNGTTLVSSAISSSTIPANVFTDFVKRTDAISGSTPKDLTGQYTIGAGTLAVGRSYEIIYRGTAAVDGGDATLTFNIGAANVSLGTYSASAATNTWEITGYVTCLVTGGSGSVIYSFRFKDTNGATQEVQTTTAVSLDTTGANIIKITWTGNAGTGGNIYTYQAIINRYN